MNQPINQSIKIEVCSLPSERGPCSDWEVQWYFDSAHENCLQFWYGGCPGNENRFATQEECEARCKSATASPPEPYPSQPVHVVKEEAEVVEPAEETYSAGVVSLWKLKCPFGLLLTVMLIK